MNRIEHDLFYIASCHFQDYGYNHPWLLEVAACALARGETTLARHALTSFCDVNVLNGLEARIVQDLQRVLNSMPAPEYFIEELYEDEREEDDAM
jgi:hypothetical protein